MSETATAPQVSDIVTLNDHPVRIEYVGTGEYAIHVVTPEGARFTLDRAELTLTQASQGYGLPTTWACWTDANGRRA